MSSLNFHINKVEVTESTNADLVKLAQQGAAEGTVVHAVRQTAGKGRHGRIWESAEGNLHVSVLLRPQCEAREVYAYSFVAAMAVFDALAELRGDTDLQLKWPNDILIDGKKVSGILIDTAPVEYDRVAWVVIGVGINVAVMPTQTHYPATSLAATGKQPDVDELLEAFLSSLIRWQMTLIHDGFVPIRRAWLVDAKRGHVSVKMPHETIEGEFGGIDSGGGLILLLADGTERVIQAGDVFYS